MLINGFGICYMLNVSVCSAGISAQQQSRYTLSGMSCTRDLFMKRLAITGSEESTYEVYRKEIKERYDLRTSHEEADAIIIQQVFSAVKSGASTVKVIRDDTDVFVLLSYFHDKHKLKATVLMEATHNARTIIRINDTVTTSEYHVISSTSARSHGL